MSEYACGAGCKADNCAANCVGDWCATECEGENCSQECGEIALPSARGANAVSRALASGADTSACDHVLSFLTFVLHPVLVCRDACALSAVARIYVRGEQWSASTTLGVWKVVPFAGVAHVQSVLKWN
jgi:hypothetical protein